MSQSNLTNSNIDTIYANTVYTNIIDCVDFNGDLNIGLVKPGSVGTVRLASAGTDLYLKGELYNPGGGGVSYDIQTLNGVLFSGPFTTPQLLNLEITKIGRLINISWNNLIYNDISFTDYITAPASTIPAQYIPSTEKSIGILVNNDNDYTGNFTVLPTGGIKISLYNNNTFSSAPTAGFYGGSISYVI